MREPIKIKLNRFLGNILMDIECYCDKKIFEKGSNKILNKTKDWACENSNINWQIRCDYIEDYYGEQSQTIENISVKLWQQLTYNGTGKFKKFYKYKLK